MLYNEPYLKPADLDQLTGIGSDRVKDWRRVGFLDDIGTQQDSGRWVYSLSDAVILATVQSLRSTRLDRVTLLDFAHRMERGILKALGFKTHSAEGVYAVFWLDEWWNADTGFSHLVTDNPRQMVANESTVVFLFDLELIAVHGLPDALKAALLDIRAEYNSRMGAD